MQVETTQLTMCQVPSCQEAAASRQLNGRLVCGRHAYWAPVPTETARECWQSIMEARQRYIEQLAAGGLSYPEIGHRLGVS
jgi:hypothetical protein